MPGLLALRGAEGDRERRSRCSRVGFAGAGARDAKARADAMALKLELEAAPRRPSARRSTRRGFDRAAGLDVADDRADGTLTLLFSDMRAHRDDRAASADDRSAPRDAGHHDIRANRRRTRHRDRRAGHGF